MLKYTGDDVLMPVGLSSFYQRSSEVIKEYLIKGKTSFRLINIY